MPTIDPQGPYAPEGEAPPSPRLDAELREAIRKHLAGFERQPPQPVPGPEPGELRPASVALVLVDDDEGRASFVLTRRASRMRRHPGQFALPGGRRDPGEDAVTTALRELDEEVGLRLPEAAVLGVLDDYPTRSGFVMTPVVIWGGTGAAMTPEPSEVETIYRVPLGELERPEVPHVWNIPESPRPCIAIPLIGTRINAPTAATIFQFREVCIHGRATRVDHYEQPVFAWK